MISLHKNERGSGAIEGLVIIIILVAIGGTGWYVYKHRTSSQPVATTSASSPASVTTPLSAGNSNSALQSDLSNITNTSAQSSQDESASTNSLNDQSTMTSVPQ